MVRLLANDCHKWYLRAQLIFVQIAVSKLCIATGQKSTSFQLGFDSSILPDLANVDNSTTKCIGDFEYNAYAGTLLLSQQQKCRDTFNNSGKCFYSSPVDLLERGSSGTTVVTSFSTMFRVSFHGHNSANTGLQGLAFIIANDTSSVGEGGGYLGWLNSATNRQLGHNFAVELDFFRNNEFKDPVGVHVGVNINNMTSQIAAPSPGLSNVVDTFDTIYPVQRAVTVWIEYDGSAQMLNVTVSNADASVKPAEVLISAFLDLADVIDQDMFVGFSGSTTDFLDADYEISLWTFNSNGPAPDYPRYPNGTIKYPSDSNRTNPTNPTQNKWKRYVIPIITIPSATVFILLILIISLLHRRNVRLNALAQKYQLEELEHLGTGAQSFKYQVLSASTKGFSSKQLLGSGGFGSVYRGSLRLRGATNPTAVAVKRISSTSNQGASEFLAEVKIIGQVQHRNLVRLLGWCHEKGELLLVYDYMPNGSLDQHLYKSEPEDEGPGVLSWARRLKIVSGVGLALAYLHEEWEQRVIHRDVKSSNVMLDINFNARLGDFGLARVSAHDHAPPSTAVLAGTRGYLAPELGHTLKVTEKTDVYSFGALVLEIATGRRPILSREEQNTYDVILLVDWVWSLYGEGRILEAAHAQLKNTWDSGEMETLIKIGLLCCHPNPDERPTMRQVLNIWTGSTSFPHLPPNKPVPTFGWSALASAEESDAENVLLSSSREVKNDLRSEVDWQFDVETVSERPVPSKSRFGLSNTELRSRPWRSTPLPT